MLLVVDPASWTWGDTWAVTGLGFGIVLALLFSLVFILMLFGWIMQKITAPRAPKAEAPKEEKKPVSQPVQAATGAPSDAEKAAIAMAISEAHNDDLAAVAYALYLAKHSKHDIPTAMISLNQRETAWNTKSVGMNNVGF